MKPTNSGSELEVNLFRVDSSSPDSINPVITKSGVASMDVRMGLPTNSRKVAGAQSQLSHFLIFLLSILNKFTFI